MNSIVSTLFLSFESFINSIFFQTLVLIATLLFTWYMYNRKVRDSMKAATTILLLQIKSIEHNIEYLKAQGISGTAINEQPLHYSIPIFEDNAWEKYKHLFATKLNSFDFAAIEQFYETAQAVKTSQILIKKKIDENLLAKSNSYYNAEYGRITAFVFSNEVDPSRLTNDLYRLRMTYHSTNVQTYMPLEYYNGLSKGLNSYNRLSGTTTLDNLRIKGNLDKN